MASRVREIRRGRSESAGGRVRFSEAAREAARAQAAQRLAQGVTLAESAREMDVSSQTLRRWLAPSGAVMRSVRVTEASEGAARAPVLVLPGGARVEGLDLSGLAELLRRLS